MGVFCEVIVKVCGVLAISAVASYLLSLLVDRVLVLARMSRAVCFYLRNREAVDDIIRRRDETSRKRDAEIAEALKRMRESD
jgi:hypothetical protein